MTFLENNSYKGQSKNSLKISFFSFLIFLFFFENINAQKINGIIYENDSSLKKTIPNANIRWKNSLKGTVSDENGRFQIHKTTQDSILVVSYTGFESTNITVSVTYPNLISIYLKTANTQLAETIIKAKNTNISTLNPILTEKITSKILAKAACCNLSESFETNAAVSVSMSDAITGAKQIQMLGLSGNYIQINTENIPSIRGLNTTFGLNYTPGTWIKNIDISKGIGSVVNGYESMSGAINVELIKPDDTEKILVNAYFNSQLRTELNVNINHQINKNWSMGSLNHASFLQNKIDQNKDGFLDIPLYEQYNSIMRWKFQNLKWMTQFGLKALYENRIGGETAFLPMLHRNKSLYYGFGSKTQRLEFFSKTARLFTDKPYKGIALISNILHHKNESYFGFKNYTGKEKSLYLNLIYQNIIQNTNHQYKIGFSYLADQYTENFILKNTNRNESVPGIYAEYTESIPHKFTLVMGSRVDFHSLYGNRFTPRAHLKYEIAPNIHLRASAGTGWRMPNVYAENFSNFVNNRNIVFLENIRPEVSDNFGLSLTTAFDFLNHQASIVLDGYRTNFKNQLIVDMESSESIRFYNLKGRSFSNSLQAEINYSPAKRIDVKLAYRYFDVQNDVKTPTQELTLLEKQFINKDRLLFNIGYATPFDKWKFDFTWQWNGKRRIPNTEDGHIHTALSPDVSSPAFSVINAQITKTFYKWELYLGGENLGNFTQKNPIITPNNPFAKNFDASMIWGPIVGRMVYLGARIKWLKQ